MLFFGFILGLLVMFVILNNFVFSKYKKNIDIIKEELSEKERQLQKKRVENVSLERKFPEYREHLDKLFQKREGNLQMEKYHELSKARNDYEFYTLESFLKITKDLLNQLTIKKQVLGASSDKIVKLYEKESRIRDKMKIFEHSYSSEQSFESMLLFCAEYFFEIIIKEKAKIGVSYDDLLKNFTEHMFFLENLSGKEFSSDYKNLKIDILKEIIMIRDC